MPTVISSINPSLTSIGSQIAQHVASAGLKSVERYSLLCALVLDMPLESQKRILHEFARCEDAGRTMVRWEAVIQQKAPAADPNPKAYTIEHEAHEYAGNGSMMEVLRLLKQAYAGGHGYTPRTCSIPASRLLDLYCEVTHIRRIHLDRSEQDPFLRYATVDEYVHARSSSYQLADLVSPVAADPVSAGNVARFSAAYGVPCSASAPVVRTYSREEFEAVYGSSDQALYLAPYPINDVMYSVIHFGVHDEAAIGSPPPVPLVQIQPGEET